MVDELAQDTSRGIGASRQAITDLLRNLEGVSGQIQQNTNNTAASIQALRDGQEAVNTSLKGIEASVDGLWAEQEAMKNRLLQETMAVQAKLQDPSPEISQALTTIENQLVSNNQLALKDGGELKDAVQTLLRSQAQAATALAEHITRGIQASALWQEQIGERLGALTREGVEVLASRQEELANRQAALSGRQDEIANVTRAAASGIRNQLNDQLGTLAAGGSAVLQNVQTIPADTVRYLQEIARQQQQQQQQQGGAAVGHAIHPTIEPGQPRHIQANPFPQIAQDQDAAAAAANDNPLALRPYVQPSNMAAPGDMVPYDGQGQTGGAAPPLALPDSTNSGQVVPYGGNGAIEPFGMDL
jgi:hypothetical protein